MREFVKRWGPAAVMMMVIFAASSLPKSEIPIFGLWDLFVKKGGHALGYGLLAAAYLRGLSPRRRATRRDLVLAVALAAIYGITDEFHQTFVPGRGATPVDVAVDSLGALLGVALSLRWQEASARRT